jgi:CO/xanthine dehydrogenase FAD-binding subunit
LSALSEEILGGSCDKVKQQSTTGGGYLNNSKSSDNAPSLAMGEPTLQMS